MWVLYFADTAASAGGANRTMSPIGLSIQAPVLLPKLVDLDGERIDPLLAHGQCNFQSGAVTLGGLQVRLCTDQLGRQFIRMAF